MVTTTAAGSPRSRCGGREQAERGQVGTEVRNEAEGGTRPVQKTVVSVWGLSVFR